MLRVEGFDADAYGDHQRVPHWEIGAELGILDLERGAQAVGLDVPAVPRAGARALARALCQLALDRNADAFEEIRPPTLVRTETMVSTGHLPKFADDAYHLERDDLWAIPTAEVPLTSLQPGRDPRRGRPAAAADGLHPVLPAGGGLGRPRHPGPAAGARVRQGRAPRLLPRRPGRGCPRRHAGPGRVGPRAPSAWPTGSSTSAPATSASRPRPPSTSRSTPRAATSGSRCRRCRGSATTRPGGPTSATGRPRAGHRRRPHPQRLGPGRAPGLGRARRDPPPARRLDRAARGALALPCAAPRPSAAELRRT